MRKRVVTGSATMAVILVRASVVLQGTFRLRYRTATSGLTVRHIPR